MYKIVVIVRDTHNIEKQILALDLPHAHIFILKNDSEIKVHIVDADIIYGNPVIVRHFIHAAKNLKWFHSTVTGFDSLIEKNIKPDNYIVTNTRVYEGMISEYVFAYMFFLEKEILKNRENQSNNHWDQRPHSQLSGITIGIMGTGQVACQIAKTAKFFEMKVLGYSLSGESKEYFDAVYTSEGINTFLGDVDYLIGSLPDTPSTRGIINKDVFANMKQSSVFINTGRGINLIVPDLLEALENKTIAGAVLDVFQKEPLSQDSELWQTDNLYITPHISGYTNDFDTIISAFTDNYYLFINGKQLNNIIDLNKGY